MIINIDMDGVLANFDKRKFEIFNNICPGYEPRYSKEFWEIMKEYPTLYFDLEPLEDAFYLVTELEKYSKHFLIPLAVLTALPKSSTMSDAEEQKRNWLLKYFPQLLPRFKIGPFASDKWKHCFTSSDILIDDNQKNIDEWNKTGGIGILHTSAEDTLNQIGKLL